MENLRFALIVKIEWLTRDNAMSRRTPYFVCNDCRREGEKSQFRFDREEDGYVCRTCGSYEIQVALTKDNFCPICRQRPIHEGRQRCASCEETIAISDY